jgi:hypothetical protein
METVNKKPENTTYLTLLADRIAVERPSEKIIFNTFLEIFEKGFNRGYEKRLSDGANFRRLRKDRQEASWNSVKDHISDLCSKQVPINNENKE